MSRHEPDFYRDQLFDLAMARTSFTVDDAADALGVSRSQVTRAIHNLRMWLGDFEDIALVCEPGAQHARFNYRLIGNLSDAAEWRSTRLRDAETRIGTIQASMRSLARATPAHEAEGRKARLIERRLRHLKEELHEIDREAALVA